MITGAVSAPLQRDNLSTHPSRARIYGAGSLAQEYGQNRIFDTEPDMLESMACWVRLVWAAAIVSGHRPHVGFVLYGQQLLAPGQAGALPAYANRVR